MSINMNEGRNKKLLVPVIALMLCATALIGAGYAAYVSSASNTGNAIGGDAIELTLTGDEGSTAAGAIAKGVIKEVDFGQVAINDKSAFYVKKNIQVGAGNLKIDLSSFKENSINLTATAEVTSEKDLTENFDIEIKFTKIGTESNPTIPESGHYTISKPTDDDAPKVIECKFEVNVIFKGAETDIIGGAIPDDCVQLKTDVTLEDIKAGFTYSVTFKAETYVPSNP